MRVWNLVTLLSCVGAGWAQAPNLAELEALFGRAPQQVVTLSAQPPAEAPAKSEEPSERQKKLVKLAFDRRPASVLEMWSKPAPESPEKDEAFLEAERKLADAEAELMRVNDELARAQALVTELKPEETEAIEEETDAAVSEEVATNAEAGPADAASPEPAPGSAPTEPASPEVESPESDPVPPEVESPEAEPAAPESTEPAEDPSNIGSSEEALPAMPPLDLASTTAFAEAEAAVQRLQAESTTATATKDAASKKLDELQKAYDAKLLDHELELFRRDVCLGEWDAVNAYLDTLPEAEAKAGYKRVLASLVKGPEKPKNLGPLQPFDPKNAFTPEYLAGVAAAAPYGFEDKDLDQLGLLVKHCVTKGNLIELLIATFRPVVGGEPVPYESESDSDPEADGETSEDPDSVDPKGAPEAAAAEADAPSPFALAPAQFARALVIAGHPVEAGEFLPSPDEAIAGNDRKSLNLLSQHYLASHEKDLKAGHLEAAWQVLQAALADGEIEDADKEEALKRAVEVAPRIADELGQTWLTESFTERPERGMEILRVIGASSSNAMVVQARDAEARLKSMELQVTAAEALLETAPERAREWAPTLDLLAGNWLKEAEYSYANDESSARGPRMTRDAYGNTFYRSYSYRSNRNNGSPQAITSDKLLEIRPSDAWLALVDGGRRPKYAMVLAQLLLKVGDETEAFPFIERMASHLPERAQELAEEFLTVWTRNHDPNSNQNNMNQYMFFYGFEQRANAIPLTRSKQERNLAELADWLQRIRALPIEKVDEELITRAFTGSHSAAEVYKVDDIERVFGNVEALEPKTLAALVQRMRSNLVGVWRDPNTQKDNKTRRRQKDIQAEVLRGYEVAHSVTDAALEQHAKDWSLAVAKAALLHDENNFRHEVERSTDFSSLRQEAFEAFQDGAARYAAALPDLVETDESADAYMIWFYASLGACDLNAIGSGMLQATAQAGLIREAIEALPGAASERHMDKFASQLFSRMGNVSPAVKFRYVRAGLEIVGDNALADEARDVYAYYRDLTDEIRLEARVDGDARVANGVPFGVYIDLRHTREIEREAGGFSKYLTNQNNNQRFSYNYGRPTENYRDKFEETTREALDEHFEVHSITFNHPDTHSQAEEQYGWRVTPYAYLLLSSRGPEVDRVPPVRLDLDFLDTSGYAVLPIESSALVIDSRDESQPARPYTDVSLVQTLDERQAADGLLKLEVLASAKGLVPDFDALLKLDSPGFVIDSIDDQGVSVSKFDEEGEGRAVITERTWMVTLLAADELAHRPDEFHFASAKLDGVEAEYQRFVDADLASVTAVVSLEERYGETSLISPLRVAAGLAGAALLGLLVLWIRRRPEPQAAAERFALPDTLTPFTVLGLLGEIDQAGAVREKQRDELRRDMEQLEGHYFRGEAGASAAGEPDLKNVARRWVQRVR